MIQQLENIARRCHLLKKCKHKIKTSCSKKYISYLEIEERIEEKYF